MGVEASIGYDKFPQQSPIIGRTVFVCFNYDTTQQLRGTLVRDDREAPWLTIIQLDDGRFVLAQECQYNIP